MTPEDVLEESAFFVISDVFSAVFVLEIIEISVERHENKLSRLFEADFHLS
jgi:hypothetical protein